MIKDLFRIVFLQLCVFCASLLSPVVTVSSVGGPTKQTSRGGFRVREPNVHAPELYADKIDFIATLVDLPGAKNKQSYWELSYQLYFIPEEKYYAALRSFPKGGYNPTPEQFPGRILLAEGHKKKTRLGTLKDRIINLTGVSLKQMVPDAQRTKFAVLMTSYSVKIFDADLDTNVIKSGIFLTDPFESDAQDQPVARKTIYLSFGVNLNGTLNYSQVRPKTSHSTSQ